MTKLCFFFMCVSYKTFRNALKMIDFALEDLDSPGLVGKAYFNLHTQAGSLKGGDPNYVTVATDDFQLSYLSLP